MTYKDGTGSYNSILLLCQFWFKKTKSHLNLHQTFRYPKNIIEIPNYHQESQNPVGIQGISQESQEFQRILRNPVVISGFPQVSMNFRSPIRKPWKPIRNPNGFQESQNLVHYFLRDQPLGFPCKFRGRKNLDSLQNKAFVAYNHEVLRRLQCIHLQGNEIQTIGLYISTKIIT